MSTKNLITLLIISFVLFLFYNQYSSNKKIEQEALLKRQENDQQDRRYCLDKIGEKVEKDANSIAVGLGRGCFLEAGCMQGVTDPNYKAKFDYCDNDYYKDCLAKLEPAEDIKSRIKEKLLDECLADFKELN